MATAKKTPSGKWKITIYDYKDAAGKIHCRSFTADTKRECERLARQYKSTDRIHGNEDMSVAEAVRGYIAIKESALSPSTIASYLRQYRNYFQDSDFGQIKLSRIKQTDLQGFISWLVDKGLSAKTVKGAWQLVHPALKMYTGLSYNVTLPQASMPDLHTPTDSELDTLIRSIRGNRELCIMSLLCAYGPMRRSEACAVKYDDIEWDFVTVRRSIVRNKNKEWVYKDTLKTAASFRRIQYPHAVIEYIGSGEGFLITEKNPDQLSEQFRHAVRNAGLPHFRLHDLRHYGASILHAIGIPDQYIMQRGGWASDGVMKRVYRDTLDDVSKTMNSKIIDFFDHNLEYIDRNIDRKDKKSS